MNTVQDVDPEEFVFRIDVRPAPRGSSHRIATPKKASEVIREEEAEMAEQKLG